MTHAALIVIFDVKLIFKSVSCLKRQHIHNLHRLKRTLFYLLHRIEYTNHVYFIVESSIVDSIYDNIGND